MAQLPYRKATIIEREAIQLLEKNNIEIGPTIMAPKKIVGTENLNNKKILQTNVYGLLMKSIPVYRYDVTIYGHTRRERQIELSKKISSDALHIDRRIKCRDVMEVFKEKYSDFLKFNEKNCVYYDLQSILYSIQRLNVDLNESPSTFEFAVEENDSAFVKIVVIIKYVNNILKLNDLSAINPDVGSIDQSLEQFLNLATSQYIMINKEEFITFSSSSSYLLFPENYGFSSQDSPFFESNGTYLAVGCKKGVSFIEGPRGSGSKNAAIIVEVKKSPFHSIQKVSQKASNFVNNIHHLYNGDNVRLTSQLKGLQVETIYGIKQKFKITGISSESAIEKRILFGQDHEREISIQEYFKEKYDITLNYPTAPLIEARGRDGHTNFYPMELCIISDNQRVKSHQQTSRQMQEMIKKCAVPPYILRNQNSNIVKSLNLENNEYLSAAKIKFISEPLKVGSRILNPPDLQFFKQISSVRTDSFMWQGTDFLIPSSVGRWAAFAFSGGSRDTINPKDFNAFIGRFLKEARDKGMNIPDPLGIRLGNSDPEVLKSEVSLAAQNGCEFIFVAHPDAADEMHAALKLCERDFLLITQGIKIGTVRNVITKGQALTLQNIVCKTNIKLGGLNYSLALNSLSSKEVLGTDTLYIGLGMCHPAGRLDLNDGGNNNGQNSNENNSDNGSDGFDFMDNKPPSTVGYAANIGKNNIFEFIGGFFYQETRRDEKTQIIFDIISRCINSFRENHRKDIRRIIIYRNGCSEGQYAKILKYEVPLIKHQAKVLGCDAPITLIVSKKLQSVRFYNESINPKTKPSEQNIGPGSVIDHSVVDPNFCEFFLNSHRSIQGTARTPKYTVLYDDNSFTMDQLEGITYHLCFGHQIVYLPTSLPSPVYIANRYAERGQLLFNRYKAVSTSEVEPRKYSELTERLGYERIEIFSQRRINA